jgi:hypothetical protein
MTSPTHYCKDCGALWRQNDDFSMSLRSANACEACDNAPVGGQLFPLTEIPLPTMPPVSVRPFCYLKQTSSERHPPHGWAVHFNDGEVSLFTAQQMEHLRQEADRAWKEVDAIAKERDDHHRFRKELADDLGDVEKQRDVLARTVNAQEAELQALRKFAQAYETLRAEADEWECDGLGLFAQHGWWEPVDEALEALAPNA